MAGGATFHAISLDAMREALGSRDALGPQDVLDHLDANAHFLSNSAHMPAPLESLLDLDRVLEQAGYAPEFRYARLLTGSLPVAMTDTGDAFFGAIPLEVLREVEIRADEHGVPVGRNDWEERAFEELFANVRAACALNRDLVGVYA